jgi:hypothetical protein
MLRLGTRVVEPLGGRVRPSPLSCDMEVVTRKKMMRRNAMSAMDDVGMDALTPVRLRLSMICTLSGYAFGVS